MNKLTLWDKDFKELNSIEMNLTKQKEIFQSVIHKTKKRMIFQNIKYGSIGVATIILFSILTISFTHKEPSRHTAALPPQKHLITPKKSIVISQQIRKSDSINWEVVSRLRYDFGEVEKIQTKQSQTIITVKRINTFGSDADPLGQIIKPDTNQRDYILKTSQESQLLHLSMNQKVLLLYGQYSQKNSPETFWAAEVTGYTQKDDKLYDSDGSLVNMTISSNVKVSQGILEIK